MLDTSKSSRGEDLLAGIVRSQIVELPRIVLSKCKASQGLKFLDTIDVEGFIHILMSYLPLWRVLSSCREAGELNSCEMLARNLN